MWLLRAARVTRERIGGIATEPRGCAKVGRSGVEASGLLQWHHIVRCGKRWGGGGGEPNDLRSQSFGRIKLWSRRRVRVGGGIIYKVSIHG